MTTVRAIVSENKHAEGLTKFTGRVLDIAAAQVNVPEWIRSIRTWLELHAIDGTASGLSVTPFVEPIASFPKENGPNSWVPIDPDTGNPALLDDKTLEKLKGAKFVSHSAVQVNLANQARVIFQVVLNSAISKQSQAAVRNSTEWDDLSVELNRWASLLNLIVKLHTIRKGASVGEAAIVAKFSFDSKIRSFKQTGSTDSGTHLERFDDLVAEGRAIGANPDQRELAFLVVNSMRSNAARNKRNLLMDLGHDTPQSYAVAKAFVLEAEAMARSVAEFNGNHPNRGHAAITDHTEEVGKETRGESDGEEDRGTNLVTSAGKSPKRLYTALQKKNWKALTAESKKKVTELEQLADKIKSGENIEVDLRTITSALTSSVAPRSEHKKCWKCKGDHVMSECPQKETIKGAPYAPVRKTNRRTKQPTDEKKADVVAVVQETVYEEDSGDDDYYYHLDNLVTYRGCWKSKSKPIKQSEENLFLDDSEESDYEETSIAPLWGTCLVIGEPSVKGPELDEQQTQQLHSLKGLSVAVRKPTNDEVAFQADLTSMPHLCRAEMQRNGWQTVSVNGVTVVKGGCFDTTSTSVVWHRWVNVPELAEEKPSGKERSKLAPAKKQSLSGQESVCSSDKQELMLKSWISAGNRERERESREEEDEDSDYEQLAHLAQECEDLTSQLADKQVELETAHSKLKHCNAERDRERTNYKRALEVVREVAARELNEAKNESLKEMRGLQSEIERVREELKGKEKAVSEVQAEAIEGSLRRSLERNSHLVSLLDKADDQCSQEKRQTSFYREAFEKERAESKALSKQLTECMSREEERVEAYRRALAEERRASFSLRQTLKDLERKEDQSRESNKDTDRELNRLSRELKEVEEKLLYSTEKGSRTEEKLRESEKITKEAIEELDNYRAALFPRDQQPCNPHRSETRPRGSGGLYEPLGDELNDPDEGTSVADSDGTRKRQTASVSGAKTQENKQKRPRRAQKDSDTTERVQKQTSPSTPNRQAPVFDPSAMQQITPIFGKPANNQDSKVEEEDQTADPDRKKIRERALRNELARLAPQNGIDLVGYTSRRTERRDADEAAALEKEKAKARRSILWNCSQSLEVRANLRVTEFSMTDVNTRGRSIRMY